MTFIYIIGVVIVLLLIVSFFVPKKTKTTYGSASFEHKSKLLKRNHKGFKIGKKSLSADQSTQHLLLLAPSGQGKTQKVILKNCFHLLDKGHSLIVTDPKMELLPLISGYAKQKCGADVYVLNIQEPHKSITWNPLTSVANGNFTGLISDMYEITNAGTKTESIWKVNTIEILVTLCKVLARVQDGLYLNLPNLHYLLQQLQAEPDTTSLWLQQQEVDELTKLSIRRFIAQDDKVFHGILSGAVSVVTAFVPDEIRPLTMTSTLPDIRDFRTQQSLLILALPIGKEQVYQPYISVLLKHLFDRIIQHPTQASDKYIGCILEEFGQLTIPNYPSIISTVRARKMMLLHCLQNLDQLSLRYNADIAAIIANNCSHWLLLPSIKSSSTLSYIRESLLGTMTNMCNDREIGRSLLNNDEIRRLPSGTGLLVSANLQPVLLRLKPLYRSWCQRKKYGLRNQGGQLHSIFPPVEHTATRTTIDYVSINQQDTKSPEQNDPSLLDFRRG